MNEEREKEELGELPEDIFTIKGEKYPPQTEYFETGIPADVEQTAKMVDAPQFIENRSRGASVRSIYDTRPINGTDFHFTEVQEVTPSGESDVTAIFSYTVPESFIAVLRKFEFIQNQIVIGEVPYIKLSILIDGITQIGHSNIEVPQDMGEEPTHIIVPENSTLSLRLIYPALFSSALTITVWAHLYGNLLQTKNKPAAFEVGNDIPVESIPTPKELGGSGIGGIKYGGVKKIPNAIDILGPPPKEWKAQVEWAKKRQALIKAGKIRG